MRITLIKEEVDDILTNYVLENYGPELGVSNLDEIVVNRGSNDEVEFEREQIAK